MKRKLLFSLLLFVIAFGLFLPASPPAKADTVLVPPMIVFSSLRDGNWEIYSMKTDGSEQTNLTHNSFFDVDPGVSANGSQIVFISNRDDINGRTDIYTMNSNGGNVTRVTGGFAPPGAPRNWRVPKFSPDGSKIVASAYPATGPTCPPPGPCPPYVPATDIYLVGGGVVRLTDSVGNDTYPVFTPDGSRIVFASSRDTTNGNAQIYIMNADGSNETRLTFGGADDSTPDVSPDGTKIAFTSNRDGNYEIYLMNIDGTNLVRITNNPGDDAECQFSRDGSQIVFASTRDGHYQVYIMNVDGTSQTRLTNTSTDERQPTFLPSRFEEIITIEQAVDTSGLTWTTGGNANWFGQESTYYYGGDAAQSAAITDNQSTWLRTTVTGSGNLAFYWSVSSESGFDFLRFFIDGIQQTQTSGSVDWQQESYSIGSGTHTLEWRYTKDGSVSSGSDCGWLDKVEFAPTPTPTPTPATTPSPTPTPTPAPTTAKILPVPYYYQGDTGWCVPTSMAMIFGYCGIHDIHSWDIAKKWNWSRDVQPWQYFEPTATQVQDYFNDGHGLTAQSISEEFDTIRARIDQDQPVLLSLGDINHAIVIVGYEINNGVEKVYVNDPSGNLIQELWKDRPGKYDSLGLPFIAVKVDWNDVAQYKGWTYSTFAIAVRGNPSNPLGSIDIADNGTGFWHEPANAPQVYIWLYGEDKGLIWQNSSDHASSLDWWDYLQFAYHIDNNTNQSKRYGLQIEFSGSSPPLRLVTPTIDAKNWSYFVPKNMAPVLLHDILEHQYGEYTISLSLWDEGFTVMYDKVELPSIVYSTQQEEVTPVGSNVTISPAGTLVTFSNVTQAGMTTVTTAEWYYGCGDLPSGFAVAEPTLDITTTAIYSGPITVGIRYDPSAIGVDPESLQMFHCEGGRLGQSNEAS
jgi:dipeptidyl aminopeptidase/acylaminoacyl peptidase